MKIIGWNKEVFDKVLDSLPYKFYILDRDLSVVFWNRKAEEGPYGVSKEDAIGKPLSEVLRIHRDKVVSPNSVEAVTREFMEVFATERGMCTENVSFQVNGGKRYYYVTKAPLYLEGDEISHVSASVEDITEKRRLEAKLIARERLSSLGEMAAGIAHQINNPLMTMTLCTDSLLKEAEKDVFTEKKVCQKFRKYLNLISKEISRCKNITDIQMKLGLGRNAKKARADINQVIAEVLGILQSMKRFSGYMVETSFTMEPLFVLANESLLNQAFFSIISNAFEAMEGNADGLLKISTSRVREGGKSLVKAGFKDNGCGIDESRLKTIFTPFFTTKSDSHTGLGLYLAHEISSEHNGWIEVGSDNGKGSVFTVILPEYRN